MPQVDSMPQVPSQVSTLNIASGDPRPDSPMKRRRIDKEPEAERSSWDSAVHCGVQSTPRVQLFADVRPNLRDTVAGGAVSDILSDLSGILRQEKQAVQRRAAPPTSGQEAFLLLEAARSDRLISALRKDLAFEIIHRNVIALQLSRIKLERAEEDLSNADERVGYVRLSIRESGHSGSVAAEYAMRQDQSLPRHRPRTSSNSAAAFAALDVILD